jgi:TM2 domain-containing membrane protein YozV
MRGTGIILIILILFSSVRSEIGEPNHKVPLFLSFIFPGGGQIYNGRYVKAAVYAALEGVLIYGAVKQNQRMKDAKDDLQYFRNIGDLEKINEFEYYVNTYTNERNNFIWMSVGAVLLSAGDAYVDSHFKSFKRDVFTDGDEISLVPSGTGLKLVYKW